MLTDEQRHYAETLLFRKKCRADLKTWARFLIEEKGFTMAQHHEILCEKLQGAVDGTLVHSKTGLPCRYLIISLPPGSAKSTYSSVIFPTWALQRIKMCRILACSSTADLIESFSRESRNTVSAQAKTIGYSLNPDSRAVSEWGTTNGGGYRCAGVGAGIAGRRADLGLIDDYIGSQEDADSKTIRDKIWSWYLADFWPRLKPNAIQVIIATRWHEEDLIGRLTDEHNSYNSPVSPTDWEVIRFPFFAEENDLLARPPARFSTLSSVNFHTTPDEELEKIPVVQDLLKSRIWPEWFTSKMAFGVMRQPPRVRSGLYQQRPAPEEGNYFKREWLLSYTQEEYAQLEKRELKTYGAGDWAVSEEKDANRSCLGGAKMDENGILYILPDIFWEAAGPKKLLSAYLDFLKRRNPLMFWSEKGHISKSWGPFLREMMMEESVYNYITEVTPSRDKEVRAQSIRGRMSMLRVRFPKFAPWWPQAEAELLTFPGGKSDDFVDFIAHIGMGINSIVRAPRNEPTAPEPDSTIWKPTFAWLKKEDSRNRLKSQPKYQGR